ncbi:DNA mismatch repair protein MutS [Cyanobium sp. CH-040]|uniref:DNA mismatch repair protein MutS n=1 Tax=Cyanobium sp. CH-040 TaxID=2823708 RepID=UPI0020CF2029|nr:DNA mismatch repair protein MutS [Cyanobium sp. CH-040]MCP9927172.1 DNA mismatch repair protein MutS [Cyanobium sp. CH-040]
MAAEAEQQLSLVSEAAVQGSLFGDIPGPARRAAPQAAAKPAATSDGLDAEALAADAAARPRRRRQASPAAAGPSSQSGAPSAASGETAANGPGSPDSDLPPWHHHRLVEPDQLTPMLRHYVELKRAHPERLLLYRLGDFFECFFEDAIAVSRLLELTLTGKEGGKAIGRVPMAGIPHHAAERYCGELVRRGLSVALCDQLETTPARGELLRRDITRVLTPGTVLEEGMLAARRNNWLCAVVLDGPAQGSAARWGLAVADVSTGEFRVSERRGSDALHQELLQLEAAEVLWPGGGADGAPHDTAAAPAWCPAGLRLTRLPRTPFELPEASATLKERFGLASLDGLGLGEVPLALRAAGGLVHYLDGTQNGSQYGSQNSSAGGGSGDPPRVPLDLPTTWHAGDALVLDAATRRNLELTRTQLGGSLHGSLLWAIDRTHTAMGGRCLRRWLEAPLVERAAILERQGSVSELVAARPLRLAVRRLLRPMGDLERLAGRAGAGSASARDLVALADGLERLPQLAALLAGATSAPLQALARPWPELEALAAHLRHTLVESPPLALSEGGLIHDGVDAQLDGLRNQLDDQDAWLAGQEADERRLSGISTLRLQYHRTFGYFLAVSRAKAGAVPEHWIRRQTLANEERFVTPELKAREGRIQQLRARAAQREYELFCALRGRVGEQAAAIRTAARLVAELDALAGLAEVAATGGYCCPEITDPGGADARVLQIEAGRHPVVEQLLVEEGFTANGIALGSSSDTGGAPDLLILTGPNASGKSCYLRQNGLLQLLAQMGSWIPAASARLGIADRIFTRVGAGDDLAAGQSTFMVEMAETANILHHATARSLVLLDEIGRGTATFDGLSIAWAVAEHLATAIGARCVFATHYHELNELAAVLPNVANARVLVEETGHDLRFLHRVVPGGASRSYGIEAARLAGVPAPVVLRARQVLGRIEANSQISLGQPEKGDGALAA